MHAFYWYSFSKVVMLSPGQSQQIEGQDGKDSKSSNPNNQRSWGNKPARTQGRDTWKEGKKILSYVSGYSKISMISADDNLYNLFVRLIYCVR